MDCWSLGSIFRGPLTGVTIGYHPRFEEVCFPAINAVMPLSSGSLAKSANTDSHFLSTASVNLEAIKKYMDRVSIFSDVCGSEAEQDRFTDTVGAALVLVNAPPESIYRPLRRR